MNSYSIRYIYNSLSKPCNEEEKIKGKDCKFKEPLNLNIDTINNETFTGNIYENNEKCCDCGINNIDEKPGKPYLSYQTCGNNNFIIEITMPYGEFADYWKLFEGDILICEGKIIDKYIKPQNVAIEAKNILPDIYKYRCKLLNDCGQVNSESMIIDATRKNINYPENFRASIYTENLVLLTWNKHNGECYDVEINGKLYLDAKSPFGYRCSTQEVYSFRIRTIVNGIISSWSRPQIISTFPRDNNILNKRVIVGYWNNYDNLRNIKLRGISKAIDVINICCANYDSSCNKVYFKPYNASVEEFISDIKYLQSRRQKICISISGEMDELSLNSRKDEDELFNSIQELIDFYGFNGIDLSLQGNCISLLPGDKDFRNPRTPVIIHLINVMKRLVRAYGDSFILIISPDINYVQGGMVSYKYTDGAYLPIIYALKDLITLIYTTTKNTKAIAALDGIIYKQDKIDFHVSMVEMLMMGFPIEGNKKNIFPPLSENKVLLALDKNIKGTCCKNVMAVMEKAFNSLIMGDNLYEDYTLRNNKGYENFKGLVVLNNNWRDSNDFRFLREAKYYLDNI